MMNWLFIANAVLRGLGRKSFRDAFRIARNSKTVQDVEETIQTLEKYDLKWAFQDTSKMKTEKGRR